jgi:uncharacterized protein (TIGR02453 family)
VASFEHVTRCGRRPCYAAAHGLPGLPKETVGFLAGLRRNNDKAWFDAHRDGLRGAFLAPAQAFIEALAPRLRKIDPDVNAEPRVNGSIMRINRDIRFSKDKSPYKDHLDLWFWTGDKKGWDSSGFFFRLTPDRLMLGAGMHMFRAGGAGALPPGRARPEAGEALAGSPRPEEGRLRDRHREVQEAPAGVAADHPRAALLRHGGLHAGWEGKHPSELQGPGIVTVVASISPRCRRCTPGCAVFEAGAGGNTARAISLIA